MKTSRLKNTVIVILLLVNAFLLVLLLSRERQEHAARERAATQLVELFAASGVELPASLVPLQKTHLASVDPARDMAAEGSFAAALLGECAPEDVGGGIYRYVGATGQCLLRASGAVEAEPMRDVGDPDAFLKQLFHTFGYTAVSSELSGGSGTVVAARTLSGVTVFNAELTLDFSENRLISVVGSFVPPVETGGYGEESDGVTALVRFLDYSNNNGEVCTAVSDVRSGYLLQSTASASRRLIPAWCVTTDVAKYYVNCSSGEVLRES